MRESKSVLRCVPMNAPPKPAPLEEHDLALLRSGQDPSKSAHASWTAWYEYFVWERRRARLFGRPQGNNCDHELQLLIRQMRSKYIDHTEISWRLDLLQRCINAKWDAP